MSGRVCYLGRADRGDTLAQVRLVTVNGDEAWDGPAPGEDPVAVRQSIQDGAAWVAERAVRGDGPRGEIALLCVDVEGSSCTWLTAPSSDASVVAAAIAQGGDWGGGSAPPAAWGPATTAEASVQALAAPPERVKKNGKASHAQKLAVVAVPDVSARLFVDALDDRNVYVDRAVSLWHALAMAWDPAGPIAGGAMRGEKVVASSAPATAVVVVDPAGRVVWAWSRGGELLAAGTIRLAQESNRAVVVGGPEASRLAADWLAWSLQLGVAPARVVCVAPALAEGTGALSQQELGMTLGKLWPGATVDLAVHDDPIGATLHRLAGVDEGQAPADGRLALLDLSRRPGRAHRAVYRWSALAVLAGSVALIGVAWKCFAAARVAQAERQKLREEVQTAVTTLAPPKNQVDEVRSADTPMTYLQDQMNKKRAASTLPSGVDTAKPILQELETLSYVLGTKDSELDELSLLSSGVVLYVAVPDTKTAEDLDQALSEIEGTHLEWRPPEFHSTGGGRTSHPGKPVIVTLYGKWKSEAAGGAGGATGGTP